MASSLAEGTRRADLVTNAGAERISVRPVVARRKIGTIG
jgi:hypothetical protein